MALQATKADSCFMVSSKDSNQSQIPSDNLYTIKSDTLGSSTQIEQFQLRGVICNCVHSPFHSIFQSSDQRWPFNSPCIQQTLNYTVNHWLHRLQRLTHVLWFFQRTQINHRFLLTTYQPQRYTLDSMQIEHICIFVYVALVYTQSKHLHSSCLSEMQESSYSWCLL